MPKKLNKQLKQSTPIIPEPAPMPLDPYESTLVPPLSSTNIDVAALAAKIEALEKKDEANQKELKMLRDVADKGRILNYESKTAGKRSITVHLSTYDGKIVVGWRTLKDILIKNPTTGLTVGEEQEYELLLLNRDESVEKMTVKGYPRFSEIRYTERIEARVVGRKEDEQGNFIFNIQLPDDRVIDLDPRFIN